MLKYFLLILGGICFSLENSFGQDQNSIDSILSLLEHKTRRDRYDALVGLTIQYVDHDNEKALQFINEAADVAVVSGDSSIIVKTRRITLQILLKLERLDKAVALGEATLPIALRLNLVRESSFLVNGLGVAYILYGQYDKGLQAYFQTFELGKQLKDSSLMAMGIYNIGIAYYKLKDYENGLKYLKRSLSMKKSLNIVDYMLLMNISLCYTQLNDLSNARKYLEESVQVCGPHCPDWSIMHLTYTKGCIAFASKQDDEAEREFLASYRLAKKLTNDRIRFDNIYYLSEIYLRQNDLKAAHKYLSEAEIILIDGSPFNLELLKIYSRLYELFWVRRDYKRAASYQLKYIRMKDSIYDATLTTNLMKVESRFHELENTQKISEQREILILNEEIIRRQFILNIVTAMLGLITTIFLFFVFRNLKEKKQLNYLLDKKIGERTLELQLNRNQLLAALKERDIMIAGTSEEISETISTIRGLCFTASREIDDPRLRIFMEKVDYASNRLNAYLKSRVFSTGAI